MTMNDFFSFTDKFGLNIGGVNKSCVESYYVVYNIDGDSYICDIHIKYIGLDDTLTIEGVHPKCISNFSDCMMQIVEEPIQEIEPVRYGYIDNVDVDANTDQIPFGDDVYNNRIALYNKNSVQLIPFDKIHLISTTSDSTIVIVYDDNIAKSLKFDGGQTDRIIESLEKTTIRYVGLRINGGHLFLAINMIDEMKMRFDPNTGLYDIAFKPFGSSSYVEHKSLSLEKSEVDELISLMSK